MIIPDFRPQACSSVREDDEGWEDENYFIEEKLNGHRALFRKDARGPQFLSRRISKQTGVLANNTKSVPHLVKQLDYLPPGTMLDGEIIHPTIQGPNHVSKLLKCLPKEARRRQKESGYLNFVVFDCLYYKGKDLRNKPLKYRRKILNEILTLVSHENVTQARCSLDRAYLSKNTIESGRGKSYVQLKHKFYRDIVENGGEGGILKSLNSVYQTHTEFSREIRSQFWRKVKKSATYDVIISGFTYPDKTSTKITGEVSANKNYLNGWISGIVISQLVPRKQFDNIKIANMLKGYRNANKTYREVFDWCLSHGVTIKGKQYLPQPFGITIGMNEVMRDQFSKRKADYLGKVMEIKCQDRFADTAAFQHPRFLRMREDKEYTWCIYRNDES